MRAASRSLLMVVALGSAAVLGTIGWILFANPRLSVSALVGDDIGYYFAIARNWCLGYGVSFDRVHATNGFNPLMTVLLIAADRALAPGLDLMRCYRVGLLVSYLAVLVSIPLYLRMTGRFLGRERVPGELRTVALAAAAAFYVFFVVPKKLYGMDAALMLPLGILWVDRLLARGALAPHPRAALCDGILLGLLVLTRVDSLPMVAATFVILLLQPAPPGARARAFVPAAAACALLLVPYFAWSRVTFGAWLPVSARIKSAFPHLDLAASFQVVHHSSLNAVDQASFLFAFLVALAVILRGAVDAAQGRLAQRLASPRAAALCAFALYLVARITYMLGFSRVDVQGGYLILAHVWNALVLLLGFEALARRERGRRLAAAVALGWIAVSLLLLAAKVRSPARLLNAPGHPPGDEVAIAADLRAATRRDDVLYGGAFGLIGFLTDRAWINGDGVANTYDYQDAIAGGRLNDWLQRSGVTRVVFLVDDSVGVRARPIRLDVQGALSGRVDSLWVRPRDVERMHWSARGFAHQRGGWVVLARYEPPGR